MKAVELFAASEIAGAINWSKRRVQAALASVPPRAAKIVAGNVADAWGFDDLPAAIRAEAGRLRSVFYYRTAADVLRDPARLWQPRVPLTRVSTADLAAAQKLQRALARALALPAETPIAERARVAMPDYAREFGHTVSDRHLRGLIARTIDRNRGAETFVRLEIFLPDTCHARREESARPLAGAALVTPVEEALATLADRERPTATERAYCWRVAIEWLQERIAGGIAEKKAKAELRDYLVRNAPFMAKTDNAARVAINAKLAAVAQEGEAALFDKRAEKSGRRCEVPDWEASVLLLAKQTRVRHGRIAQAWRELWCGSAPSGERFSDAFKAHWSYNVRRAKSEVPARVRRAVAPMIAATHDLALGPRAARLRLPSIPRDHSDTKPGFWHTSDDVTLMHYWFSEDEFGKYEAPDGWRFNVTRGQWLPLIDEATDYPLEFVLIGEKGYTARDIKALCCKAWMREDVGLPQRGAKFERGIWDSLTVRGLFSWANIDESFTRAGITLRLQQATTPGAKVIESFNGRIQNMADHIPGFCGRDEKRIRHERVAKFIQRLKCVDQPIKAAVDPREMLLSGEELADELKRTLLRFAAEPSNGERYRGLSPAEAWQQGRRSGVASRVLPETLRYLLAADRSEQKVTHDGIVLKIGGWKHKYCGSERLGELRDEKVEVYFNPLLPEHVSVIHRRSDKRGEAPFSVPLFKRLPANTATAEDFAEARAAQKSFAAPGRRIFREIAPPLNATIRNENLGSPELRETGARINELEREQITLRTERGKLGTKAARIAARHGVAIDPAKIKDPARVLSDASELDDLEARIRHAETAAENQPPT